LVLFILVMKDIAVVDSCAAIIMAFVFAVYLAVKGLREL
jgi:hypothetical protein